MSFKKCRSEARRDGDTKYHGAPCRTCSGTERYVACKSCVACKRTRVRGRHYRPRSKAPIRRGVWHLLAIPPAGEPFVLLSPATSRPLELEFGRAFAERLAKRESARLAWTGWSFEARAG